MLVNIYIYILLIYKMDNNKANENNQNYYTFKFSKPQPG